MLPDGFDASRGRQRRGDVPRQQILDAVRRMIGDALEYIGEIRLGIEAVQPSRAEPSR